MITEDQMPIETMKGRVNTHKCGVCNSDLTLAWGGTFGYNGYVLRCSLNLDHDVLTDYKKPSQDYEEGNKTFRRLQEMDTTALMKMDKNKMLARIAQARFPQDLKPAEIQLMAEVSISYGLDPLMQELMVYQGNPYVTINARYRKAQETGEFDGIDTRPATPEERKSRNAEEGDFLYRCEAWRKGTSHPFVGWGRVGKKEIERAIAQARAHNRREDALPIVNDPDRHAEKRAEAMGLRKGFSMPVPFKSWEELEEELGEEKVEGIIEAEGKVVKEAPVEVVEEPAVAPAPPLLFVDVTWLKESLKTLHDKGLNTWSNAFVVNYLNSITGGTATSVVEAVKLLDKDQAQLFVAKLSEALASINKTI